MESLRDIFESLDDKLIHKWDHYIEVYETYFEKYRNKEVHVLEIGVSQGGSIELWKRYFGDKLHLYGVDINPRCKELEEDGVKIFIGEQEDKNFLSELKSSIPKLDILIDDGGHTMIQQIVTFEEMYEHVKEDGIYLCEDTHTSYMYAYHGGIKKSSSFIEYSKNFIDFIHAWHSESKSVFDINYFTKSAYAVHFYTGIVVVEKKPMQAPKDIQRGNLTVGYVEYHAQKKQTLWFKIQWKLKKIFNKE
ncbi:class I SAM-dependent methyltransferase [Limnovirga soli]|uniref:Class I SAM-dependent methyltransferase n=1 Tax=Limnovirga soli TaxID=2656915 RepID=A0A8J8JS37_9BACT|nr:class I SAM-dependent methyltransferase [Limnovirga soli]NNV54318.1 class I SAM-dependent methyltransferase [Limnovirga soli]